MFATLYNNLRVRLALLGTRFQELWQWLQTVDVRVRRAIWVDVTCSLVAMALVRIFKTNVPAQIAFIPVIACWLYIARITAVNIWITEIGVEGTDRVTTTVISLWDRLRGSMPRWVTWFIGTPQPGTATHAPHGVLSSNDHREKQVVWHDTSIGGHVFHILSTVWMWMHALLYVCGTLPVWLFFFEIVMISLFILFFVGTEDFVNIKRWRAVLGVSVGIHATIRIAMLVVFLVVPHTYEHYVAKYEDHEHIQQTKAEALRLKTLQRVALLARLETKERDCDATLNNHLDHAPDGRYDTDWTIDTEASCDSTLKRIRQMESPSNQVKSGGVDFFPKNKKNMLGTMMGGMIAAICLLILGKK